MVLIAQYLTIVVAIVGLVFGIQRIRHVRWFWQRLWHMAARAEIDTSMEGFSERRYRRRLVTLYVLVAVCAVLLVVNLWGVATAFAR